MEDTSARKAKLGQMMKPLNPEQKMVMEGLLEKTPTAELEKDFKKYLKPVLKESGQPRSNAASRTPLTESQKEVTGDRKQKLFESDENDQDFSMDLDRLTKIAGIRK